MDYTEDVIVGAYAHATKAVKFTSLASGHLPIDDDPFFEVGLLSDDDQNCSLFVMTVESELLRSESFEWKNREDTTERLFKLCDYIDPADWAQMDATNDCSWNLRKLDAEVILMTLAKGYRENGEEFDPSIWRQKNGPQKKAGKKLLTDPPPSPTPVPVLTAPGAAGAKANS